MNTYNAKTEVESAAGRASNGFARARTKDVLVLFIGFLFSCSVDCLCCMFAYCYYCIIVSNLLCVSYLLVVFARARTKDTPNLPTNLVDFRGLDSSIVLI